MQFKTLSSFQIGGHTYEIKLKEAFSTDGSEYNLGITTYDDICITVATKASTGEYRSTSVIEECLLHELIHASNHVYNAHMDEDTVKLISQGLYQILKQFGLELIKTE